MFQVFSQRPCNVKNPCSPEQVWYASGWEAVLVCIMLLDIDRIFWYTVNRKQREEKDGRTRKETGPLSCTGRDQI